MSNLNGGNVRSLMEAYNSIYEQPQEETLTEEQVWEEVEAWVNSLIEEGYDLSQFTWEEVFQVYVDGFEQLDEQGQRGSGMRNAPSDRFQQQLSGVGSFFRGLGSQGTMQGGRSRFNNRRPQPTTPTANPAATSRPVPTAASGTQRPTAPVATSTPKPTDTKPTTPAGGAVADQTPAAPAKRPSILSGLDDLKKMRQASQIRQQTGAPNVTSDMIGDKSVKAPTTPRPQLSARAQALKAGGPKLGPRGM